MVMCHDGAAMSEHPDKVTIKLDRAVALALFEWSYRFMQTQNPQFTHPADAIAIDQIASELEWELTEVFTEGYTKLLHESRNAVVTDYRRKMSEHNSEWLQKLSYQDVGPGTGT